jgi:hypothetical protein
MKRRECGNSKPRTIYVRRAPQDLERSLIFPEDYLDYS